MIINSPLSPKAYTNALRSKIRSVADRSEPHLAGFTLGRFFSVSYRSAYHWNRRVRPEYSATGFVLNHPDGCEVCYFRMSGMSPLFMLGILIFAILYCLLAMPHYQFNPPWLVLVIPLIVVGIIWFSMAVSTSLCDDAEATEIGLQDSLLDPTDPNV